MLKGEVAFKYDLDQSLGLFRKIPTFVNNESDVALDSFHLKMSDILLSANLKTLNDSKSRIFRKQEGEDIFETVDKKHKESY